MADDIRTRLSEALDGACECLTCTLTQNDLRRLVEDGRRSALVDAYWKLRDHASQLRETSVYSDAVARTEDQNLSEEKRRDARNRVWALECRCRGLEDGCRDLAMLLAVDEVEIERPAGTQEADRQRMPRHCTTGGCHNAPTQMLDGEPRCDFCVSVITAPVGSSEVSDGRR